VNRGIARQLRRTYQTARGHQPNDREVGSRKRKEAHDIIRADGRDRAGNGDSAALAFFRTGQSICMRNVGRFWRTLDCAPGLGCQGFRRLFQLERLVRAGRSDGNRGKASAATWRRSCMRLGGSRSPDRGHDDAAMAEGRPPRPGRCRLPLSRTTGRAELRGAGFRFGLADSQSGSAATRPPSATKGQSGWESRGGRLAVDVPRPRTSIGQRSGPAIARIQRPRHCCWLTGWCCPGTRTLTVRKPPRQTEVCAELIDQHASVEDAIGEPPTLTAGSNVW
jgi:hypothetical protein